MGLTGGADDDEVVMVVVVGVAMGAMMMMMRRRRRECPERMGSVWGWGFKGGIKGKVLGPGLDRISRDRSMRHPFLEMEARRRRILLRLEIHLDELI